MAAGAELGRVASFLGRWHYRLLVQIVAERNSVADLARTPDNSTDQTRLRQVSAQLRVILDELRDLYCMA